MDAICGWCGITRQAHYQKLRRQQKREKIEEMILAKVQTIRQRHPRMGGRKLLRKLGPELDHEGISLGRDRFFDLLGRHDLLVSPPRQRRKTTRSGIWRSPNLLKDLPIITVQQVWVGDITYLQTEAGFCYLFLLTDAYSRYIVGYDLSTSLAVEGASRALEIAIDQASFPLRGLIHHTDHGIQYACRIYRERLEELGILSSMGEVGNCYENALAERMNGILKQEYGLDDLFTDFAQAKRAVWEAIWLYNFERPHLSLDYEIPARMHTIKKPEMVMV
jgi:transposase InsO family protein